MQVPAGTVPHLYRGHGSLCDTTGWRAWSPALNAPVKASLAPFGPRERPRLFLCLFAGQHISMQPPARDVIPIKELGRPAILEPNLEGSGVFHGLMLHDYGCGPSCGPSQDRAQGLV